MKNKFLSLLFLCAITAPLTVQTMNNLDYQLAQKMEQLKKTEEKRKLAVDLDQNMEQLKATMDKQVKEVHNRFFSALYAQHTDVVKELLCEGIINVNYELGRDKITPLIEAIESTKQRFSLKPFSPKEKAEKRKWAFKIVKMLLAAGADANKPGEFIDTTPLIVAAWTQNIDVIKELLKVPNINVNARDKLGRTALSMTMQLDDIIGIVKELLKRKDIGVNIPGVDNNTPLLEAVAKGNIEVVNLLLKHPNIDPNIANKNRITPLYWAVHKTCSTGAVVTKECINMIQVLFAHPKIDVNATHTPDYNPLALAVLKGKPEVVKLLLAHPDTIVTDDAFNFLLETLHFKTAQKLINRVPNDKKEKYEKLLADKIEEEAKRALEHIKP